MHVYTDRHDKTLVAGRGGGKTAAVVEWAQDQIDNRIVVTSNARRAGEYVRQGIQAISASGAQRALTGQRGVQVAVDEVRDVLAELLGTYPEVLTITVPSAQALPPSDEIVLLRERDISQKQEISDLRRTIDTLIEMAGLRCYCDNSNGPEQDCPWHGDRHAVIVHRNPDPEHLAQIAEGLRLDQKETVQ